MVALITKDLLGHSSAFEKQPDFLFIRHTDTAMHLDAFVAHEKRHLICLGFRETREQGNIRAFLVEGTQPGANRRDGKLDLGEHERGV